MEEGATPESALCVQGGRIQAVGPDEAVLQSSCAVKAASAGHVIDLEGMFVVPGLTDSHAHLMMEAARHTRADLTEAGSAASAAQAAVDFAGAHPDLVKASGGWVLGFGWDQTKWPGGAFPTHQDLDQLFPPETPVFLEQLSGHACWVNSRALELAGAHLPATGDPPGGHIERNASGSPTGILSDRAKDIMFKLIPPLSEEAADAAITNVFQDCAAHGLTGVHDLDCTAADVELLKRRQAEGSLPLRVYAFRDGAEGSPEDPIIRTEDGLLTVQGVKFYADGAMGSWSAAMLRPYDDRPNVTGTLIYHKDDLLTKMHAWAVHGYQLATHAIGDASNREVLDVYEELLNSTTKWRRTESPRWRVEHAQILSAADLPRFAELGVIPSMQPSHCAADLLYAEQRLGRDRASRSYAWRSLLRTGVRVLPFGSDFPTAGTVPPVLGLHAAMTRETPEGVPAGGWFPEQKVSGWQALKGYTVDAAYASFRELELGKVLPMYRADLTIFDRDVTDDANPQEVLNATVLGTIVGGRAVYVGERSNAVKLRSGIHSLARSQRDDTKGRRAEHSDDIVRPRAHSSARLAWWWRKYVDDRNEDRRWDRPAPAPGAGVARADSSGPQVIFM